MTTPKLSLPTVTEGATNNESQVNDGLKLVDGLLAGRIEDRDLATPPGSPSDGDAYIVAASPTGDWAGQAGNIAIYDTTNGWQFVTPTGGMSLFIHDEKAQFAYSSQESLWYPLQRLWTTTEYWTGMYGEGGTKQYAKVVDVGALPNNTTKNTAHSISNIDVDNLIEIVGYAKDGTDVTSLPLALKSGAATIFAEVYVNATNVRTETNADLTAWDGQVWIAYEKTA